MPLKPPGGPSRQTIGSAGQSVDDDDQLRPPEPNWKWVADLEVLCDFTDKTLEGELADEEFRRFLVATDLTKGDCTGAETMGLLHTTCGLSSHWRVSVMIVRKKKLKTYGVNCFLGAGGFGGELFTGGLAYACVRCCLRDKLLGDNTPPVVLRAVCLVRAMCGYVDGLKGTWSRAGRIVFMSRQRVDGRVVTWV